MKVLGMISGTSHDGIDVAVVDFVADRRRAHAAWSLHTDSTPYRPDAARPGWCAALPPASTTLAEVCELDTLIGQAFAEVAAAVVAGVPVSTSSARTARPCSTGSRARTRWARSSSGRPPGSPSAPACRSCPTCASATSPSAATVRRSCRYLDTLLLAGTCRAAPAALNLGGISQHDRARRPGRVPAAPSTSDRRTRSSTRWWRAPAPTPTATTPAGAWPRPDRCTTACWPSCSTSLLRPAGSEEHRQGAVPRRLRRRRRGARRRRSGRQRPGRHADRADRAHGRAATSPPRAYRRSSSPEGAATTRW